MRTDNRGHRVYPIWEPDIDTKAEAVLNRLGGRMAIKPYTYERPTVQMRDVPSEYRRLVETAMGSVDSFETTKLRDRLLVAQDVVESSNKRLFGLLPGSFQMNRSSANTAAQKDPVAKELIQLVINDKLNTIR